MRQSFSSRASLPLRVLARLSRFLGRTGSVTRSSRRDRRRSGRFRGAHRSCRLPVPRTTDDHRRPAAGLIPAVQRAGSSRDVHCRPGTPGRIPEIRHHRRAAGRQRRTGRVRHRIECEPCRSHRVGYVVRRSTQHAPQARFGGGCVRATEACARDLPQLRGILGVAIPRQNCEHAIAQTSEVLETSTL